MRITIDGWIRTLGFVAVACTLVLSLPGIRVVHADEPAPQVSESPGTAPDASFEGFARHLQREHGGDRAARSEAGGPTCNANSPIAVEMSHRQALAQLRARMLLEARARAASGQTGNPEIVVLNGSGYNYRSPEERGPAPPSVPAP